MPEDDEWNHAATEPFDTDFLLEHGVLFEEARTLLISTENRKKPDHVVLVLGDHYTMWSAGAFKAWAARLLKQL